MALLCAALVITSCPDPEGSYNDWLAETEDMRVSVDMSTDGGQVVDFSGNYLLTANTPLGGPLLFGCTINVHDDLTLIDITIQPILTDLTSDGNPRDDARTPTGDPIGVTDVPYNEDGTFVADFGEVSIPAQANPIGFRPIVANLILTSTVLSNDQFCGLVGGRLIEPFDFDLTGSTFNAVMTDDLTSIENPTYECPGGSGDADADAS